MNMEEKQEQLARYLHDKDWNNMSKEYRRAVLGSGMQWSEGAGASRVPASQRLVKDGQLRQDLQAAHTFDAPEVVKREPLQRLESMIERLKDTPAPELETALRNIQAEYWKLGAKHLPSIAELRRETAKAFLQRADRRQ